MSFAESANVAELAPRQRSRVTNGSALFVEGDGRTPWSRRFRDLCTLHSDDLGGADLLTEAQASLVRRVATIEVQLEQMEGDMSEGGDVSLDLYTRSASHLRRILETLGIDRKAKDVTPGRDQYLAARAQKAAG